MAEVIQKFKIIADDSELRSKIASSRLFLDSQLSRTTETDRQMATGRGLIDSYNVGLRARLFSPIGTTMGGIIGSQSSQDPGLLAFQSRFSLAGGMAMENLSAYGKREFYANALLGGAFNPNMSQSAMAARTGAMQAYAGLPVGTFAGLQSPTDLMNKAKEIGDFKYQFEARNFNDFMTHVNQSGTSRLLMSSGRMDQFFNQYKQAQPLMESLNINGTQSAVLAENLLRTGARPDRLAASMRAFGGAMAAGAPQDLAFDALAENRRMQVAYMRAGMPGRGADQAKFLGGLGKMESMIQIAGEQLGVTPTDEIRAPIYKAFSRLTALNGRDLTNREMQYAMMNGFGASVNKLDNEQLGRRADIAEERRRRILIEGENQNKRFQVMEEEFSSVGGFIKQFSPGLYNKMQRFTSGPVMDAGAPSLLRDISPRMASGGSNPFYGVNAGVNLGLSSSSMSFGGVSLTDAQARSGTESLQNMGGWDKFKTYMKAAGNVLLTPGESLSQKSIVAQAVKSSGITDKDSEESRKILSKINTDVGDSRRGYRSALGAMGVSESSGKNILEAAGFMRAGQIASGEGNSKAAEVANKRFEELKKGDTSIKSFFEGEFGQKLQSGDKDALGQYESAVKARNQYGSSSVTSFIANAPGDFYAKYLETEVGKGLSDPRHVKMAKEWANLQNKAEETGLPIGDKEIAGKAFQQEKNLLSKTLTSGTDEQKKTAQGRLTEMAQSAAEQMTGRTYSGGGSSFSAAADEASKALAKLAQSSGSSPRR